MDFQVLSPKHGLASRLLQPAVVPHGDHAEHGEEERAAVGQDVSRQRGHQLLDKRGL